jgi:hypothetical protein
MSAAESAAAKSPTCIITCESERERATINVALRLDNFMNGRSEAAESRRESGFAAARREFMKKWFYMVHFYHGKMLTH